MHADGMDLLVSREESNAKVFATTYAGGQFPPSSPAAIATVENSGYGSDVIAGESFNWAKAGICNIGKTDAYGVFSYSSVCNVVACKTVL